MSSVRESGAGACRVWFRDAGAPSRAATNSKFPTTDVGRDGVRKGRNSNTNASEQCPQTQGRGEEGRGGDAPRLPAAVHDARLDLVHLAVDVPHRDVRDEPRGHDHGHLDDPPLLHARCPPPAPPLHTHPQRHSAVVSALIHEYVEWDREGQDSPGSSDDDDTPMYTTASCLGSPRSAEPRNVHSVMPSVENIAVSTAIVRAPSASSAKQNERKQETRDKRRRTGKDEERGKEEEGRRREGGTHGVPGRR